MRTNAGVGGGGAAGSGAPGPSGGSIAGGHRLRPGALQTFRSELGELWPAVEHRCILLGDDDMVDLSRSLERHMHAHPECAERVGELANDLMALLAGWAHFGEDERRVLAGAMAYLADPDDVVPDVAPGGLDDDDLVVRAAVRALLRPRRLAG